MKPSVYEGPMIYQDISGLKVGIVWAMSPKAAQHLAARLLEKATAALNARKLARAKRGAQGKNQ